VQSICNRFRRSPKTNWVYALFLLGLVSHASTAIAQTPGTFTPVGNMITARLWNTATLLTDGRVLIAGGVSPTFSSIASAELYDPDTGTFVPTGNMITARLWHTATLLPDGKVLIVGGSRTNTGAPVTSAELYDPSTGAFTATGTVITAQIGHRATLLGNGKVLIVGGIDAPSTVVRHFANPELYDPSTGLFAATGTYTSANHEGDGNGDITILATTTTLLADGRVLVLWGIGPAELYDPAAYTFSPTGTSAMLGRGGMFPATLLMNGQVLVAGGTDGGDGIDASGTYDPSTGTFTATGNMTLGRYLHTATLLPDGTVLIVGGYGVSPNSPLARAELYDPATGTFSTTGGMTSARGPHTATLLNNGQVLITGGGVSSTELYNPPVLVPATVLFSLSGDGQGQGAIQHAGTYRIASSSDPAITGEALTIYATGLVEGSVIPPQVAIGGRLAEVISFGITLGYPGLNYVNVRMPSGVAPGDAVPVRLSYLSRPSNEVTIGTR
jgi:Galactose oxidase, central domain